MRILGYLACLLASATAHAGDVASKGAMSVSLSADDRRVVASYYDHEEDASYVKLWDTATGKLVWTYTPADKHRITDARFSPDGKLIAVAGFDAPVQLVDPASGKVVKELVRASDPDHPPSYTVTAFSPDGTELCALAITEQVIFNVGTGKEVPSPMLMRQYSVIGLSGHRWMFERGELWAPGMTRAKQQDLQQPMGHAVMSQDAKRIVSVDYDIYLTDPATLQLVAKSKLDEDHRVQGIPAISPNGKWIVVGTYDGLAWFETAHMKPLYTWHDALVHITDVVYASDGKFIVTGHDDGIVRIVDVTKDKPKLLHELGTPFKNHPSVFDKP